jgi:hypothetical protein
LAIIFPAPKVTALSRISGGDIEELLLELADAEELLFELDD